MSGTWEEHSRRKIIDGIENQSEDRKLNSKNFNKKAISWGFREPLLEKV